MGPLESYFVGQCYGYLNHYCPWLNWRNMIVIGIWSLLAVIAMDMLGAVLSIGLIVAGLTYLYHSGYSDDELLQVIAKVYNTRLRLRCIFGNIANGIKTFYGRISFMEKTTNSGLSDCEKLGILVVSDCKKLGNLVRSDEEIFSSSMENFYGFFRKTNRNVDKFSEKENVITEFSQSYFVNKCCGYLDHYCPWLNWRNMIVIGIWSLLAVIAIDKLGAVLTIGLIVAGLTYLYLNGYLDLPIMLLQDRKNLTARVLNTIFQSFINVIITFRQRARIFGKKITSLLVSGCKKLGSLVGSGYKKLGSLVESNCKKLGNLVGSGCKNLGSLVGSGCKKLGNILESGFKKLSNFVGSGWKKLGSSVGSGTKKLKSSMENFLGFSQKTYKNADKFSVNGNLFTKKKPNGPSDPLQNTKNLFQENKLRDSLKNSPNTFEDTLKDCKEFVNSSLKMFKYLKNLAKKICDGFMESAKKNYIIRQSTAQKELNDFYSTIKKSENIFKSIQIECRSFRDSIEQKCDDELKSITKKFESFQADSSNESKNIIYVTEQKWNNLVDSACMELKNCMLSLEEKCNGLSKEPTGFIDSIFSESNLLFLIHHHLYASLESDFNKNKASIENFRRTQTTRKTIFLENFDKGMTASKVEITGLLNSLQTKRDDLLQATEEKCREFEAAIQKKCDKQIDGIKEEFDRLRESSQNIPRDMVDTFLKKCNDLMEQHQKKFDDSIEFAENKLNGFGNFELLENSGQETFISYSKSLNKECSDLMESIQNICDDLINAVQNECTCFEKSAPQDGVENSIAKAHEVMNFVEDKCKILVDFYQNRYEGALKPYEKECNDFVMCVEETCHRLIEKAREKQNAVLRIVDKECKDFINSIKQELDNLLKNYENELEKLRTNSEPFEYYSREQKITFDLNGPRAETSVESIIYKPDIQNTGKFQRFHNETPQNE